MAGLGYLLYTAGQVLTAAQVNGYLMQQSIMVFATTAARDSALTSVKSEGMITYQLDNNDLDIYNGSSFSTLIAPAHGVWTTFAPVVNQGGAVTHTDNYAKYQRIGRYIHGNVYLTMTGAGTGGNGVSVQVPVTAAQNFLTIGSGRIYDSSAALNYSGIASLATTTAFVLIPAATNDAGTALGALNFTAALASPDEIYACFIYEAAADA